MRLPAAPAVLLLAVSLTAAHAQAEQDPAALAREGTSALEAQRFGDALDAFTRAAALQPQNAGACFGAGVAAFMLGQNDVARARFECALALKPGYVPAALWLGDLHYRAGRLDEAVAIGESVQQRSPDARDLREQLALWRRELALQRRFHQLHSDHFTAQFQRASDEGRAREITSRLEAAYARVGQLLGVYPSERVTVVLYSRQQFNDITGLRGWSVAAYDGRIRVPLDAALDQRDELDRVLSHEYVHVVVARSGGRSVPAWLNEGLATVLEAAPARQLEAVLDGGNERPALSALHRSFVDLSHNDAEAAYAVSARAVNRLLEQGGAPAVVGLLEDLGRGEPFAGAFERRFGVSYEQFAALVARAES